MILDVDNAELPVPIDHGTQAFEQNSIGKDRHPPCPPGPTLLLRPTHITSQTDQIVFEPAKIPSGSSLTSRENYENMEHNEQEEKYLTQLTSSTPLRNEDITIVFF